MKPAYAIIDPEGNVLLNFIRLTQEDCIHYWKQIKGNWDPFVQQGYMCGPVKITKIKL